MAADQVLATLAGFLKELAPASTYQPGDEGKSLEELGLDSLDALMTEKGFLDGSRMANVFNMMRPRDLIWPYVVNNYMLGKKPFPFDLLFWNQDSTRMAAANHKFYLREFYNENRLAKGEMEVGGIKLDLKKINLPIFSVATSPAFSSTPTCLAAPAKLIDKGSARSPMLHSPWASAASIPRRVGSASAAKVVSSRCSTMWFNIGASAATVN